MADAFIRRCGGCKTGASLAPVRGGGARPRRVVPGEPARETVESREEHALGDVRLVELVPDLPLQRRGNDDAPGEPRFLRDPVAHADVGARGDREDRELVAHALVERGGMEEGDERAPPPSAELRHARREPRQHLGREEIRALAAERAAEDGREAAMRGAEVDAPDDAVARRRRRQVGREVERDVGRERPVEKPGRQAVVLREREPVPGRAPERRVRLGELPEVAQEVRLDRARTGAELLQRGRELEVRGGLATEHVARPEPSQRLDPGVRVQDLGQLAPGRDDRLGEAGRGPSRTAFDPLRRHAGCGCKAGAVGSRRPGVRRPARAGASRGRFCRRASGCRGNSGDRRPPR